MMSLAGRLQAVQAVQGQGFSRCTVRRVPVQTRVFVRGGGSRLGQELARVWEAAGRPSEPRCFLIPSSSVSSSHAGSVVFFFFWSMPLGWEPRRVFVSGRWLPSCSRRVPREAEELAEVGTEAPSYPPFPSLRHGNSYLCHCTSSLCYPPARSRRIIGVRLGRRIAASLRQFSLWPRAYWHGRPGPSTRL